MSDYVEPPCDTFAGQDAHGELIKAAEKRYRQGVAEGRIIPHLPPPKSAPKFNATRPYLISARPDPYLGMEPD